MDKQKIIYSLTKPRGELFKKGFFITFTSLAPFWLGFLNSITESKKYLEVSNLKGLGLFINDFFRSFVSYNSGLPILWNIAIWLGNLVFAIFFFSSIFSFFKKEKSISGFAGIITGIIFIFIVVFIIWTVMVLGGGSQDDLFFSLD